MSCALTEPFELRATHFWRIQSLCGHRPLLSSMTHASHTAPLLDGWSGSSGLHLKSPCLPRNHTHIEGEQLNWFLKFKGAHFNWADQFNSEQSKENSSTDLMMCYFICCIMLMMGCQISLWCTYMVENSRFRYEVSINKGLGIFSRSDADNTVYVGYKTKMINKKKTISIYIQRRWEKTVIPCIFALNMDLFLPVLISYEGSS